MRKRVIAVSGADRAALVKIFRVTDRTIRAALLWDKDGSEDNDLHKRIRKAAMERGGILLNTLPEAETFHDADGKMRQWLGNGVLIEADKRTGDVDVWHKGALVSHFENVKISYLRSIQLAAAAL